MTNVVSRPIILYISSDVLSLASYRLFQVFCTWFYIQNSNQEENLASVMLFIWLSNLFFLPINGSILEKCRKTNALLTSCAITSISTISLFLYITLSNNYFIDEVIITASIILSAASSLLMPLGVSLIPEISSSDEETIIGIKIKSATFIANLIFGPMLGGFLIVYLGGLSVLVASLIFSFLSIFTSSYLVMTKETLVDKTKKSFLSILKSGVIRTFIVKEERIISIVSALSNLFLVPFLFLLLPSKVISSGYTMFEVSIIEVFIGIGMVISPLLILPYAEKLISKHMLVCIGQLLITLSLYFFSIVDGLNIQYIVGFFLGIGLNIFNVTINSSRAISIPNGYRAPMEASFLLICTMTIPLGFWISKQYIETFPIDSIISLSLLIYVPSLIFILFSSDIKELVSHPPGNTPYYREKYRKIFYEVNKT